MTPLRAALVASGLAIMFGTATAAVAASPETHYLKAATVGCLVHHDAACGMLPSNLAGRLGASRGQFVQFIPTGEPHGIWWVKRAMVAEIPSWVRNT